jgi:hypothetical protein
MAQELKAGFPQIMQWPTSSIKDVFVLQPHETFHWKLGGCGIT